MKLTVITGGDARHAGLISLTYINTLAYCKRHKFRLRLEIWPIGKDPPSWKKLSLLKNMLDDCEDFAWMLWVDSDTVIIDHTADVYREFVEPAENAGSYMACCMGTKALNAGVMALKNCYKSHDFLHRAMARKHCKKHKWWDQQAMIETMDDSPDFRSGVFYHELFPWNVQPKNYRKGTRLIHAAGNGNAKLRIIKKFVNQISK